MSEVALAARCSSHPDRPAVRMCDGCGRPLCAECREETLLAGLVWRFSVGLSHCARSLNVLAWYYAPVFVLTAIFLLVALFLQDSEPFQEYLSKYLPPGEAREAIKTLAPRAVNAIFTFLVAFGMALSGVVLSQLYTGFLEDNPYRSTVKRFIPWVLTWIIVWFVVLLGLLLGIVPGIVAWLRLSWAGELALSHGATPIAAVRGSWFLTQGTALSAFGFHCMLLLAYVVVAVTLSFLLVIASAPWLRGVVDDPEVSLEILPLVLAWVVGIPWLTYCAIHAVGLAYFYGLRAAREILSSEELERPGWIRRARLRVKERHRKRGSHPTTTSSSDRARRT